MQTQIAKTTAFSFRWSSSGGRVETESQSSQWEAHLEPETHSGRLAQKVRPRILFNLFKPSKTPFFYYLQLYPPVRHFNQFFIGSVVMVSTPVSYADFLILPAHLFHIEEMYCLVLLLARSNISHNAREGTVIIPFTFLKADCILWTIRQTWLWHRAECVATNP